MRVQALAPAAQARWVALANDALAQVSLRPAEVTAWWRLVSATAALPSGPRDEAVARLQQLPVSAALPAWLRLSALWCLTGDLQHLMQMTALAPQLPGTDRWMALSIVLWGAALSRCENRHAFRQVLVDGQISQLMDQLGRGLARPAATGSPPAAVHRVALYTPHLASGAHAGTAMTFNLQALLARQGIETQVFAGQELSIPDMRTYFAGGDHSTVGPAQSSSWPVRSAGDLKVSLADADFSLDARWRDLLALIGAYAPDLVLYVGFASPIVWPLHARWPVVGMSLHTLPPVAPVDVWLNADPEPDPSLAWPGIVTPEPVHFPHRFWPAEAVPGCSRESLGIAHDAVLCVSSGSRLSDEMTDSWTRSVTAVLDRHPKVHWLLIGVPEHRAARLATLHARARCMPFQDNFAGWLQLADLYLNPPRLGGGASVATAMSLGVPVLSLAGSDGGDKVGDHAVVTIAQYMNRFDEWIDHPDRRRAAGQAMRVRFDEVLDLSTSRAASRLLQACQRAVRLYQIRQTAAESTCPLP